MANRNIEGFDWFPSGKNTAARQQLWAANAYFLDATGNQAGNEADVRAGRFGFGKAFSYAADTLATGIGTSRLGYAAPVGAVLSTGFLGFAFRRDSTTTSNNLPGVGFFDGVNGAMQIFVGFDRFGVIKVYRDYPSASNPPIATSIAGAFEEDEDFHVEIKPVIADSGGSVEVRINTVPKVQLTGADTQLSAVAGFDCYWLGHSVNAQGGPSHAGYAIDDLFVNDTSGSSNNNWAGNLRVKSQFMIGDGATDNFLIGGSAPAPTHWQSVGNQNLDDGQYVYSATVGNIDLYTADPNLNAPLVRALQVRSALRQDDSTQRVARHLLRIGGTNYLNAADQFTNQTYTFYKSRWDLSPASGVTFTGSEVNALQPGLKVQA